MNEHGCYWTGLGWAGLAAPEEEGILHGTGAIFTVKDRPKKRKNREAVRARNGLSGRSRSVMHMLNKAFLPRTLAICI